MVFRFLPNALSMVSRRLAWLTVVLLLLAAPALSGFQSASAHAPRENYVWVNVEQDHISGRFEINAKDIKKKLGIDIDAGHANRGAGVLANAAAVQDYLREHFAIIDNGTPMPFTFDQPAPFPGSPDFIQYPYHTAALPSAMKVVIEDSVFLTPDLMKDDRLHRSVLVVAYNRKVGAEYGEETSAMVFTPDRLSSEIDLNDPSSILTYKDFTWQGVLHIWAGIDHVLFLLVLLLTAVLRLEGGRWEPVKRLAPAAWNIFLIVTVFTVAHSITFALTALGYINVNMAMIETIIAISIIAVALNNIFPRYAAHTWAIIFVFGLFHGIGFASAMSDLQFRTVLIHQILLRFNIGVELGQLAIVAVAFPILFSLRNKHFYKPVILYPLSGLAIVMASYWVLERTGIIGG